MVLLLLNKKRQCTLLERKKLIFKDTWKRKFILKSATNSFAARDFIGGDNNFWQHTPLMQLYDYYFENGQDSSYAIKEAGKAAGRLLLGVLIDDRRTFEVHNEYTKEYRWTVEEEL